MLIHSKKHLLILIVNLIFWCEAAEARTIKINIFSDGLLSAKHLGIEKRTNKVLEKYIKYRMQTSDEIIVTDVGSLREGLSYDMVKRAAVVVEEQPDIVIVDVTRNDMRYKRSPEKAQYNLDMAMHVLFSGGIRHIVMVDSSYMNSHGVKDKYKHISHRYYALKAKWLGKDKLDYWNRNAPLPMEDTRNIPYDEAVNIVLDAYGEFSPKLRELGEKFFDNAWIDVPPRSGKDGGAFAHPTVPSVHPYLMLNYQGKVRDVMTLAHELGHGVHQILAAKQGVLMSDTPLTLAETASVFGEQLTFRALLNREKDPEQRKIIIAGKVEDMINTVIRQVAFCEFERQVHDERKEGEISSERLAEIWRNVQEESLGSALRFDEHYDTAWAYIPHFIHSPFYVYAYAFGDCLVNTLYGCYLDKMDGFEDKYFALLEAGGTLRHKELLEPFGLDLSQPDFWQRGLDVISSFIDELEAE